MKANSKRKVFGDAVDLLMGDMEKVARPRGVQMVPVKNIQPFHDHPFHLYEGERLEDMIASVKEHGVLNPVIVQKLDTGYEMLSGHNRWNAAKLAGIKEIPAIVKTDLSEEEAYVYIIETNLMQRSFSDLAISEKAAVLKARYEKEACQGKRNDILEEIARLEGKEILITRGHDDHRLKTRDMIGKEYELSGSSVGRLLKLNDLIKPFKDMVDRGALYTKVALQLAFLPENEQTMVYEIMKEKKTKITIEMVMKLRSHSGALTEAMVKRYLSKEPIKKKCYKVPARIVEKYFEGMDPNQVDSIVESNMVALIANGGMGKSMMLRHLFVESMKKYSETGVMPILVELRDFRFAGCDLLSCIVKSVSQNVDYKSICGIMSRSPDWMPDIQIRGDGYETKFYKKD